MLLLIDYENVSNSGLYGVENLDNTDKLILFYSGAVSSIERGYWNNIISSCCFFDVVKLIRKGKNGIDFYIATKLAEEVTNGFIGRVAIISNDKGYDALKDYWHHYGQKNIDVIIRSNIRDALIADNISSQRCNRLAKDKQPIGIEGEFRKIQERKRLELKLKKLFIDTPYLDMIHRIINIVNHKMTKRDRYLIVLKEFGRNNGLEIYRIVSNLF